MPTACIRMTIFVKYLDFIIMLLPPTINFLIFFKSAASKPFSIPCLFTCFKLLIKNNLSETIFRGKIMNEIDEAMNYNKQHQLNFANTKRKLPEVDCVFTSRVQTQTDFCRFLRLIDFIVFIMVVCTVSFTKYFRY